jgi:ribosomal protein S18 acetylase RimI-like enzyme
MSAPAKRFTIRPYVPADRAAVRRICCETGFLGKPVDPLFEDRELFADYLTRYYTDLEPESCFVLEKEGEVRGYLIGSRRLLRQKLFRIIDNPRLFLVGFWRYFTRPYNAASRAFVKWILTQADKESPLIPPNTAHFHINLLEDARSVAETRDLFDAFLGYLARCGEKRVYAQMVVFENRRREAMFRRYGFQVLDRREVTKFRDLHDGAVYLFTVLKDDLHENPSVYARA